MRAEQPQLQGFSDRSLLADGPRCFLAILLAGVAAALLIELPKSILQDTWLALVDGREVADHGIPHHVVLTAFGHGHAWTDQQWLAQLWMYWLHQIGGLGLLGVANVALIMAGLAGAVIASLRLGANPRAVLAVLPAVAIVAAFTNEVRTQPYAYPLFVLTIYLLAADSRRPSRTVYWCLPVLVLWANLHGSASLGAGLVALRGLTMLWPGLWPGRGRDRGVDLAGLATPKDRRILPWRRALVLIVAAPATLLATPYGTGMISYYHDTLLSPAFRKFVTEWQPVTANVPLAIVFFALAGVTVWSLGRFGGASTLWERLAVLILGAGAIIALRNVVWFALATLVVLPVWIDRAAATWKRPSLANARLNRWLLIAAGAAVAVLVATTLTAGSAKLIPNYPSAALKFVRADAATRPSAQVYADETYADWLLWELPSLRGRVAYDAAFELLTPSQLRAVADFKAVSGQTWLSPAAGARVFVLAASPTSDLARALRAQAGARLLYAHDGIAVMER